MRGEETRRHGDAGTERRGDRGTEFLIGLLAIDERGEEGESRGVGRGGTG